MEMLGGVLVLGRIAAADMATGEAQTEVNPFVVHLKALFTAFRLGLDLLNFIDVRTGFSHDSSPLSS
jgi:hypothetical protein